MLIVGGGLAGGLLALALRERGVDVCLIAGQQPSATEWSYGVIPGWPLGTSALAIRSAKAAGLWRDLQRRYGDLGWSSARIHLHGGKPWARLLPLPGSQVDTERFHAYLPELLKQAGVRYV
ncbi:MAG: FAD-dependent oxidoreductase, partial [Vulcanococcus sp.]